MAVWIAIDEMRYQLPNDTDVDELRKRVAQAVFRCEVEQIWLIDGRTVLVNWRSVRTIRIEDRSLGGDLCTPGAPREDDRPVGQH